MYQSYTKGLLIHFYVLLFTVGGVSFNSFGMGDEEREKRPSYSLPVGHPKVSMGFADFASQADNLKSMFKTLKCPFFQIQAGKALLQQGALGEEEAAEFFNFLKNITQTPGMPAILHTEAVTLLTQFGDKKLQGIGQNLASHFSQNHAEVPKNSMLIAESSLKNGTLTPLRILREVHFQDVGFGHATGKHFSPAIKDLMSDALSYEEGVNASEGVISEDFNKRNSRLSFLQNNNPQLGKDLWGGLGSSDVLLKSADQVCMVSPLTFRELRNKNFMTLNPEKPQVHKVSLPAISAEAASVESSSKENFLTSRSLFDETYGKLGSVSTQSVLFLVLSHMILLIVLKISGSMHTISSLTPFTPKRFNFFRLKEIS